MPLTMMQKRDDLASYIQSLLVVHDTRFTTARVDTTERKELEQNQDRKSRIKITGDPERYCLILDTGENVIQAAGFDAAGDVNCRIGHGVDIRLFWQKDYNGSQDDFEAAVYNDRGATKPGLLDSLRNVRRRTVAGSVYMIGLPGQDAFTSVQRGSWDFGAIGEPEMAHYLQITTTLIDL